MIADDYGFTTDEVEIMNRAMQTPAKVERLLAEPRALPARLNLMLSKQSAAGMPGERDLSALGDVAATVGELKFRPVCYVKWGSWPIALLRAPQWVGPDGFTKLEIYGHHFYLSTYFDDGHAISTSSRGFGMNECTSYLRSTGDFEQDYRDHLQAVRNRIDQTGAKPLYRPTPETLIEVWKIYPYFMVPTWMAIRKIGNAVALVIAVIMGLITLVLLLVK